VRIRFRSGRSLLFDTAFHSPAAMACLAASLRGRVNAPGLHLQSRLRISFDPFGSPLPPLSWVFCAPQGAISAVHPLSNPIRKRFVCAQAAAPLQDLSILPVHSALPKFSRKSLPLRVARSAFTPRRVENNLLPTARRINAPAPLLPAWLAYVCIESISMGRTHLVRGVVPGS